MAASDYKGNFILKGGLFIYALTSFESRATVDVDFMLQGIANDTKRIDAIIAEILAVPTGNDYISLRALPTEPIAANRKYRGLSTQITGYIKNVRIPFSVDIGVGDVIVPSAQSCIFQTQLEGFQAPEIMTYSLESTVAEKFDAILQRFELTGRMKDFYDIYYLSQTFDFDGSRLQAAIAKTLNNRGTAYDDDSFGRLTALVGDGAMQVRWRYFLRTLQNPDIPFSQVMDGIAALIGPVWNAYLKNAEFTMQWKAEVKEWGNRQ